MCIIEDLCEYKEKNIILIGKDVWMNTLQILLEHCYGINKLNYEFDLTVNNRSHGVFSIYAPNGFMKSSLARTFDDISNNQDSRDVIFPERQTVRNISADGEAIAPDKIFVIKPYEEAYTPEQASLLLVNSALKQEYDDALKQIARSKSSVVSELKTVSQIKSRTTTLESVLCRCFGRSEKDFFELLTELSEVKEDYLHFSDVSYNELFNDKTIKILSSGNLKDELAEYIETYEELIDRSPILSKSFNHQNANSISKSLNDTGFFSANHSVNMTFNGEKQEFTSHSDLQKLISEEQEKVFTSKSLAEKFAAVDKKLGNVDARKFRDYLSERPELLPELANYLELQKKLWIAYVQKNFSLVQQLVKTYQSNKSKIESITEQARNERTIWESVVDIFNKRFNVPFKVKVLNQEDVILNSAAPAIGFDFDDGRSTKQVEKNQLLDVLSQGERRALYILNLLFDIEAKKQLHEDVLFIIDDIADSFDYKNKYSIIEYLKDLAYRPNFKILFLTHNFDFHRTICSRIGIYGAKRLFAIKTDNEVLLTQERYQRDVLTFWKTQLSNDIKCVLACIPFARNLAEYCGYSNEYDELTSLLHFKANSANLSVSDLQRIYRAVFADRPDVLLPDDGKSILQLLEEISQDLANTNNDKPELEHKIIMSIAIRLKAEQFMIAKINDNEFVDSITKNQTNILFERFINDFSSEQDAIEVLDQVNLMTPENIHLNSFMYEPILDMSAQHLYGLHASVMGL